METHFDYAKVKSYGQLAKALVRRAAGVQQSGHAFDLERALDSIGLGDRSQEKAFQDEKSQEFIKERKKIAPFELSDLQALPDGSFGRSYADFMIDTKRKPKFFAETEITDDISYRAMRMTQTQDMWQVLVGFDESASGKAGFSAFLLAQTGDSLPSLTIASSLLRSIISSPADTKRTMNDISRGWLMGLKAEPLFSIDWEAHWVTPISEMRRRYLHANRLREADKLFNEEDENIGPSDEAHMDA